MLPSWKQCWAQPQPPTCGCMLPNCNQCDSWLSPWNLPVHVWPDGLVPQPPKQAPPLQRMRRPVRGGGGYYQQSEQRLERFKVGSYDSRTGTPEHKKQNLAQGYPATLF